MIIIVCDLYSTEYPGGAELTTDAFLESGFDNFIKFKSTEIDSLKIEKYKDKKWIFGNFSFLKNEIILEIIKKIQDYSVIEYDYKYCKYRSKQKHIISEGSCNCNETTYGKLISLFFYKSKNLFFMSEKQKKEYELNFPFLSNKNSHVISSSFSQKTLDYIKKIKTINKNDKYLIINSSSWIKGIEQSIKYANENNLKYDIIENVKYDLLLKKMSEYKGIIFLPNGYDTCPRVTIEAKLLGCDLILNDNVQHKDEKWFKNEESILEHIKLNKKIFFDLCLKNKIVKNKLEEKTKFHFIIPCFNVEDWIYKCLNSIRLQNYQNYTVTIINDVSTDNTKEILNNLNNKFTVINNIEKKYALKNITEAIESIDSHDEDVFIILDGDDWLSSTDVLDYLNKIYIEESPLVTYGSYQYYPSGEVGVEPSEYPKHILDNNDFRKDKWRASHLRTFKRKLWNKIDKKDFLDEDGNFFRMAYDQALMLPLMEISNKRIKFIKEILYIYNRSNPLNVDKIKQEEQYKTMLRIRNKNKYKGIDFEN